MPQLVQILADSISPSGVRITTFRLKFHRFILPEFNVHRLFSRNASSSRAQPSTKVIKQVLEDPAIPLEWGKNRPGMQAHEQVSYYRQWLGKTLWVSASKLVCGIAYLMNKVGLHKQIVNRILEPFQWVHVIVTATDYQNFFALRNHPDAQPEIRELAKRMQILYTTAQPKELKVGEWHLPYINFWEMPMDIQDALKVSAARCCRVSYLKHDDNVATMEENIALYNKLVNADPPHMSPVEHQAQCTDDDKWHGNFYQWHQYRKMLETPK